MLFSRILVLLFFISSCATNHNYQPTSDISSYESKSSRYIASTNVGMSYPASATYDLSSIKGTTYITFLKNKLKPSLDVLSDKKNGGGGGFQNIGAALYKKNSVFLNARTLSKYKGAKWDRDSRTYRGGFSESEVENAYEMLKKIRPTSTVDSIGYFDREDKGWMLKNDMAVAMKEAGVKGAPFDLGTLYALTSGLGVKVKLDDNNYNYHVLYKTGKTNPREEVMSGRSFASSPGRGAADATDPEYLRDLSKYLKSTQDQKPFYRALILSLANSDTSEWSKVSHEGQALLSDFLTVYTAEAVRHIMVDLKDGLHPWEIDLAAVTAVCSMSVKTGKVIQGGLIKDAEIGEWFAPSPNNVVGGPQRSGIGITRRDRVKLQLAIYKYEMTTNDGREVISKIQQIIGTKFNQKDVIQGVFEFLSNNSTPEKLGAAKASELADLFAQLVEMTRDDAEEILKVL